MNPYLVASPAETTSWSFPAFERCTLPSGLRMVVCPLKGRGMVAMRAIIEAGPGFEDPARMGVAALTARGLLEGTRAHDGATLGYRLESIGASIDASVDWDVMRVAGAAPVTRWRDLAEAFAEVVRDPAFEPAAMRRLQQERINQLAMERLDPGTRAGEALAAAIYPPGSRYATPIGGNTATIESLTPDLVAGYYAAHAGPSRVTLVVAGDVDAPEAEHLLGNLDGTSNAAPSPQAAGPPRGAPDKHTEAEARCIIIDRPGAAQSAIAVGHVGFARSASNLAAITLVQQVLGGSGMLTTRLNKKLREEKGYTYGCYASFDLRRQPGPFAARTMVETTVTVNAVRDIHGEIQTLRDHGVSPTELEVMRNFVLGSAPLRLQTPSAIADAIADQVVHDLPDDHFESQRREIRGLSASAVGECARYAIDPQRLVTVVFGDATTVRAGLEASDLGPVSVIPLSA